MANRYQKATDIPYFNTKENKVYLVGGGAASLASAAYLIKDGKMDGKNITIYEELPLNGGCMDGIGTPEKGYVIRGGRMFDYEAYTCTYDLLSFIPSLTDPEKSVKDEIFEFNKKIKTHSRARLVDKNKTRLDVTSMGFSRKDRIAFVKLMLRSEESLGTMRIDEWFEPSFFETNFWYMWCTTFAFQPWHSLVEFKRYLHRFIHEFPKIHTLAGVWRTPYNQYDSITLPLEKWLKEKGVRFETGTEITDLEFKPTRHEKTVTAIRCLKNNKEETIQLNEGDLVFITIGSMAAGSSLGSMSRPPKLENKNSGGSWKLWEKIAKKHPFFGRPTNFSDRIHESTWESFTCTFSDPTFFRKMKEFTGNDPGTGALVTFKDSNWLMSIVLAYQPHFINQPAGIQVCWGDGLYPDRIGNFVQKKMSDCTGEEILTELCYHLGFVEEMPLILKTTNCIPCLMPYIGSQFLTRGKSDRPDVIPKGSTNLAFIGQYAEIKDDVVFTVEYSVRTAQKAVFTLLDLNKKVSPLYKGERDPRVILRSIKTMYR